MPWRDGHNYDNSVSSSVDRRCLQNHHESTSLVIASSHKAAYPDRMFGMTRLVSLSGLSRPGRNEELSLASVAWGSPLGLWSAQQQQHQTWQSALCNLYSPFIITGIDLVTLIN
ncbi:hypothetical protein RRG08_053329 [Elysia crispata]|uniref:Uncharacterized protein n=1 Tax=Elysia crispata TaxID=231223 RepID=A0AAE1DHY4_9GAST|nr:hypothetical protein RRG08_053329 [Elysia crispata]